MRAAAANNGDRAFGVKAGRVLGFKVLDGHVVK
jgi:hypothetical protein